MVKKENGGSKNASGAIKAMMEPSLEETSDDPEIKVDNLFLEKETLTEKAPEQKQAPSPEVQEVNAVLIESIAVITGKTLALLTSVEELNFDEQEINQLVKIWTPVLPAISPLAVALLGTTAIVSAKVAIYVAYRRIIKKEKERVSEQRSTIP